MAGVALEVHPHLLAARGLDGGEIMRFLASYGCREVPGLGHLLLVRDS